jgi:hypothetical protein
MPTDLTNQRRSENVEGSSEGVAALLQKLLYPIQSVINPLVRGDYPHREYEQPEPMGSPIPPTANPMGEDLGLYDLMKRMGGDLPLPYPRVPYGPEDYLPGPTIPGIGQSTSRRR